MSYMGIDVGTGGCKAAVFDRGGALIAPAYREYTVISPEPGKMELNSDEVCTKVFEAIREAATAASDDPVRGIGISSQGEAFTPIGKDGKILANAMVSSDVRSKHYVKEFGSSFGKKQLYEITGHTAHTMFSLFKLLWLRENEPDVWRRTEKFLCFEDLIQFRLGLDPAMGWPLAGRTMLFDVRNHTWHAGILSDAWIDENKLARPLPSGTVSGNIPRHIAGDLGLTGEPIVVCGGHDQVCGALGAGVVSGGKAMYATGSVECITPAFSECILNDSLLDNNLCTYDHAIKDLYTTVAFSLTGGNLLRWFRDEWGQKEIEEAKKTGIDAYEIILRDMDSKPATVMTLPYFTPSGTPYFDIETPGAILGLRLTTKRSEILKSLLEGVTFEMKLNLHLLEKSGIHIDELIAVGGGSKSKVWAQLKADILDTPISTLMVGEAGCLGAAMLACAADTGVSPAELIITWVTHGVQVEPDREKTAIYGEKFEKYLKLYPAMKRVYAEIDGRL
jgi:xylulokinase